MDRATLTELATAREAAIITGLGTSWPAHEQWATAAGLCEAANQHLGRVYSQERDHFAFDDRSKPFAVLGPSQRRVLNMSCAEFMQWAEVGSTGSRDGPHEQQHLYLSWELPSASDEPNGHIDRLADWAPGVAELLAVAEPGQQSAPTATVNVWLGARSVVAQTHYDAKHNVIVQVAGTKRFELYPPSDAPHLYLHPHAHPHDRHSQVFEAELAPEERHPCRQSLAPPEPQLAIQSLLGRRPRALEGSARLSGSA